MVAVAGSVFRYRFKVGGRVVHCGFTTDLARRERETPPPVADGAH